MSTYTELGYELSEVLAQCKTNGWRLIFDTNDTGLLTICGGKAADAPDTYAWSVQGNLAGEALAPRMLRRMWLAAETEAAKHPEVKNEPS